MSIRVQQVEALLREQVSQLIWKNLPEELGIVTVTDVAVAPDLKKAKIYISLINKDQEKKALKTLEQKTPDFNRYLGRKLKMRYSPRLSFIVDRSENKVDRVEELLKEIDSGT